MVAYTFVLAGIAPRVLCARAAPPSLCSWLDEGGDMEVPMYSQVSRTWGDRTGYWGFEQQGRPDGYGEEENRCCMSPAPSTALAFVLLDT